MLYDSLLVIALLLLAGSIALPLTGATQQAFRDPLYTVYLAGVWFLYLGWCWTHGGQTLGLRAWKVRIVADEDGPVGWRASAIRFSVSLLSAAIFGAGFWAAWLHPQRATWHDRASRTRCVRLGPPSDRASQDQDHQGHQQ